LRASTLYSASSVAIRLLGGPAKEITTTKRNAILAHRFWAISQLFFILDLGPEKSIIFFIQADGKSQDIIQ
jgi:hypothetical protein